MNYLRSTAMAIFVLAAQMVAAQTNSKYTAYVQQYKDLAVQQMKLHKIPASITLAQGLLESAAGASELATKGNNHFGIKCHTDWTGKKMYKDDDNPNDCFRVYKNASDSYEDHSQFLLRSRYSRLFLLDPLDYKSWAKGLKECGYATSPTYADNLISIIERYQLYQYDSKPYQQKETWSEVTSGTTTHHATHSHEGFLVNNIVCYLAEPGDTWGVLATELGVSVEKLLKYNECDGSFEPYPGMNVFIRKKKNSADKRYRDFLHTVQPGESMYTIAQKYGMRMGYLYKKNKMPRDYNIQVGDQLRVR